ncbi:MAG: amino acid ABC transporter permease [Treponema sp.]|nr:amino acid ABC transporter permease [Treponema sp.]
MNIDFSISLIPKISLIVLPYLKVTILSMIFALLAGTVISVGVVKLRLHKCKPLNSVAAAYVGAVRCTPAIILIFIVFYGLPFVVQIFGANILNYSRVFFLTVALAVMFSATFSEVMRSAYLSVNKGQREAGIAMGLSEFQTFYRIILPQAFIVAIPNLGNSVIFLFKDTSLAYTIGVIDLMGMGNLYITQQHGTHSLEAYLTVGMIYWFFVILLEHGFSFLEKYISRGRK